MFQLHPSPSLSPGQLIRAGGYRLPSTGQLSPAAANRHCPRLPSPVPGEHVPADQSRQGERHRIIVNIAQELLTSHSIGRIRDLK